MGEYASWKLLCKSFLCTVGGGINKIITINYRRNLNVEAGKIYQVEDEGGDLVDVSYKACRTHQSRTFSDFGWKIFQVCGMIMIILLAWIGTKQ